MPPGSISPADVSGLQPVVGSKVSSAQKEQEDGNPFEPDFCASRLDSDPWIVQPFEIYEEIRIEEIIKKHKK